MDETETMGWILKKCFQTKTIMIRFSNLGRALNKAISMKWYLLLFLGQE